jgi:hypothetical protein
MKCNILVLVTSKVTDVIVLKTVKNYPQMG